MCLAHRVPTTLAGSGRCGARRSGIKGEPARAEDSRGAECRTGLIPHTRTPAPAPADWHDGVHAGDARPPHGIWNPAPYQANFYFIQAAVLKKLATTLPGATSASQAVRISSDSAMPATGRACASCASVRGPMIGAVTPGWSLTHR